MDRDRERAAEQVFEEFVGACLEGRPPDPGTFLDAHPDLRSYLAPRIEAFSAVHQAFSSLPPMEVRDAEQSAESPPIPRGTEYRGFVVEREIGHGGMGTVYLASQPSLDRQVALKILPKTLLVDERAAERFRREGLAVARLRHKNIVQVLDSGEEHGTCFLAMEYIKGMPLDKLIKRLQDRRPWSEGSGAVTETLSDGAAPSTSGKGDTNPRSYARWVAATIAEVAEALEYAHGQGVLHRDVKPSNIIISTDGVPRLVDFGLASLTGSAAVTATGDLFGTPRYMAPEQIEGGSSRVDKRADVYSLGLVLYEMVTLKPAFDAESAAAVFHDVLQRDPKPPRDVCPAVPKQLESVILKATDKDAGRRYQSATELAQDLRRFINEVPVTASRVGRVGRIYRRARRHPWRTGLAAATALLLIVGGYAFFALRGAARQERAAELTKRAEDIMRADGKFWNAGFDALDDADLDKARTLYEQAIDNGGDSALALSGLGATLCRLGQEQDGRELLSEAARKRISISEDAYTVANRLFHCSMYALAAEAYEQGLRAAPNPSARRWNDLGDALYWGGQPAQAADAYAKANQMEPKDGLFLYNLGVALRDAGRVDGAVEKLERAGETLPDDYDVHSDFALALAQMGQVEKAENEHRRALALYPENPILRVRFAKFLLQEGRLEEAAAELAEVSQILEREPDKQWESGSAPCRNVAEELKKASSKLNQLREGHPR